MRAAVESMIVAQLATVPEKILEAFNDDENFVDEIKRHVYYHDCINYLNKANACYDVELYQGDSVAIIYLASACELMIKMGFLFKQDTLSQCGMILRECIQVRLRNNKRLRDRTLQVLIETQLSSPQIKMRKNTTASQYSTLSMAFSTWIDPIVIAYAKDDNVRDHCSRLNESLHLTSDLVHHPYSVTRFRLNTEHGQSINVFRAEIRKTHAQDAPCLVLISLHGNSDCAANTLADRMLELDIFLLLSDAEHVVLLLPDLPGSVASGGHADSLEEISKNSVQALVHHLVQQGTDPAHIVVRGQSLGGLIATHAVHALRQQGVNVSLISVDSLSRIQRFVSAYGPSELKKVLPVALAPMADHVLPALLEPIAAQFAIKHFNAPADTLFMELYEDRRFCIYKIADEIIPPPCSLMFSLPGNIFNPANEENEANWRVGRDDCFLIVSLVAGHNVDIVHFGHANPCLTALIRIYNGRTSFKKATYDQLSGKVKTALEAAKAHCILNPKSNTVGYQCAERLLKILLSLSVSDELVQDKIKIVVGWILSFHEEVDGAFNLLPRGGLSMFIAQAAPYRSCFQSLYDGIQRNSYLNTLIAAARVELLRYKEPDKPIEYYTYVYKISQRKEFFGLDREGEKAFLTWDEYALKFPIARAVCNSFEEMNVREAHHGNLTPARARDKERHAVIVEYAAGVLAAYDLWRCVDCLHDFLKDSDTLLDSKSRAISLMKALAPQFNLNFEKERIRFQKSPQDLRELFCVYLYTQYLEMISDVPDKMNQTHQSLDFKL